ncbi:hypothetical protein V6N13_031811 [Hibiscus sabdariffa]
MADEFAADGISKKLGIIGFCFGGGQVIDVLAADLGACFGTDVSFYGTRMNPGAASKIKLPVLSLAKGSGSSVVIFKGRGHAFSHRPGSVEEDEDAEQAFTLMRNWLHDGLE